MYQVLREKGTLILVDSDGDRPLSEEEIARFLAGGMLSPTSAEELLEAARLEVERRALEARETAFAYEAAAEETRIATVVAAFGASLHDGAMPEIPSSAAIVVGRGGLAGGAVVGGTRGAEGWQHFLLGVSTTLLVVAATAEWWLARALALETTKCGAFSETCLPPGTGLPG